MPLGDIWRHASGRSGAIFARRALGLGGASEGGDTVTGSGRGLGLGGCKGCDTVPRLGKGEGGEGGAYSPCPAKQGRLCTQLRAPSPQAHMRASSDGSGQGRPGASGCM